MKKKTKKPKSCNHRYIACTTLGDYLMGTISKTRRGCQAKAKDLYSKFTPDVARRMAKVKVEKIVVD